MGVSDLESLGMHWMDDADITTTLATQSVGVLGLNADGGPCLRPLSYWFDEEHDALYFTYLVEDDSEKVNQSENATSAQFLVYNVETTFNWRSVLVTGTIEAVPEADRAELNERLDIDWQPDLFERASTSKRTALYRLDIQDKTGIKQLELPPDLREASTESRME